MFSLLLKELIFIFYSVPVKIVKLKGPKQQVSNEVMSCPLLFFVDPAFIRYTRMSGRVEKTYKNTLKAQGVLLLNNVAHPKHPEEEETSPTETT